MVVGPAFLLGTAIYATFPSKIKYPLLASVAVAKNILLKKKKKTTKKKTKQNELIDEQLPVLRWKNIHLSMHKKTQKTPSKTIQILSEISGEAHVGRLFAIVGPSGSGKTSLLNALAERVPGKNVQLSGLLRREGRMSYVEQEDAFFAQLTVKETLLFAVKLARSKNELAISDVVLQDEEICSRLMTDLGLMKCAETKVGDAKTRGCSGGEKKRLSLACHLVSNPKVIFLDEPTSGLDSYQALNVVQALKRLCEKRRTIVVCSIHQPRQKIVDLFDDVTVLSSGKLMYHGSMDNLEGHFENKLGQKCPRGHNILEFVIDLISVDASTPETMLESEKLIAEVAKHASRKNDGAENSFGGGDTADAISPPAEKTEGAVEEQTKSNNTKNPIQEFLGQFPLLFHRAFKQVVRDKTTNRIRLTANLNSALVFGSIFWKLKMDPASMQNRFGLLQVSTFAAKIFAELPVSALFPLAFGCVVYPMTRLQPTVPKFLKFSSAIIMESFCASAMGLAISSVAPSTEAAIAMGPGIMVLFIVFGGYYVNVETVPLCFRWINKCSLIREGFQCLCCNEFTGLKFTPGPTGEKALENLGFDAENGYKQGMHGLGNTLGYLWLLTLYLLENNEPTFAVMKANNVNEELTGMN
jgi:ABC-type multidrug transport system ATPase subunit